jgi:hypothetical protein
VSQNREIFVLALLLWFPLATRGQILRSVRSIEITSSSSGRVGLEAAHQSKLSAPTEAATTAFTIHKEGQTFHLNDQVIDATLIENLIKALSAPVNPEFHLDDLGITPAWLKANAAAVAQSSSGTLINGAHPDQARLEKAFADPAVTDAIVPELFDRRHYSCADCRRFTGSVKITITFEDGTSLEAWSGSEFPFMLPWTVRGNSTGSSAFNADISRALVALLPEQAANRSRLSGEYLAAALGRAVMHRVEKQAQLDEVESKTGGTFGAVRAKYTIESANINSWGDPVLRKSDSGAAQGTADSNLYLRLRPNSADPATNFFYDEVALQYLNGSVVDTDQFLQSAPQFEKLVCSVPWLSRYLQEEQSPKPVVKLSVFHGVSFSDAALKAFAEDMHAIGRDDLVSQVEAARGQIAFLIVGSGMEESDWLIFPDRHMLLWRFFQVPVYGKPSLLKWQASDFVRAPCAHLRSNVAGCVGAWVSPDGDLRPTK